jgi:hypothetical protein
MKRKPTRKPKSARAKAGAKAVKAGARKKTPRTARAAAKSRSVKPRVPDPIDALVEAGVQALTLPLDPDWRGGVKFNLQLVLRHAAVVEAFPLADDAEPAPVFRA